jgi:hypothetical protein
MRMVGKRWAQSKESKADWKSWSSGCDKGVMMRNWIEKGVRMRKNLSRDAWPNLHLVGNRTFFSLSPKPFRGCSSHTGSLFSF